MPSSLKIFTTLSGTTQETLLLLEKLTQAAIGGGSRVLFTSWDAPSGPLDFTSYPVRGLAKAELPAYFKIYGLDLTSKALDYVADYSDDIVCLEMFVRSPEWRAATEAGHCCRGNPSRCCRTG